MRWLERYLVESSPRLQHFAENTASLAQHRGGRCGERACLQPDQNVDQDGESDRDDERDE